MKNKPLFLFLLIPAVLILSAFDSVGYQSINANQKPYLFPSLHNKIPSISSIKNKPTIESSITINAVGDIMVHDAQIKSAKRKDGSFDFDDVFSEIKPYVEMADFTIGNLETTISPPEKGYGGYPQFRSPEGLLKALKSAGFDVLTTANNHCLDGGESGAMYTLDKLKEYGFKHTGTAKKADEEGKILIIEKNDIRVAILAYTYGTNYREKLALGDKLDCEVNFIRDKKRIFKDIENAKKAGVHKVIVCMHWGEENQRTPNDKQKQMADELFSMGADIILGAHPHMLQPIERRKITTADGQEKEVLLAYSLGNFISNQSSKYNDSGVILSINIARNEETANIEIRDIYYIPTWVYKYNYSSRSEYKILPVGKFLYDKNLNEKAQKRIQTVWEEVTYIMGNTGAKPLR